MPLIVEWQDTALRLLLTIAAGAILGLNRGARGHAAGLRTTILVALAAAVAMTQMNILLSVGGKTSTSFSVMDIMRLPLGILTGVGFIGGGTILKRGDLVTGVTTAATLWIATVIGLCFGGGQTDLGIAATALSAAVLWPLRWLDVRMPRRQKAELIIIGQDDLSPLALERDLDASQTIHVHFRSRKKLADGRRRFTFDLSWKGAEVDGTPQNLLAALDARYEIDTFEMAGESEH